MNKQTCKIMQNHHTMRNRRYALLTLNKHLHTEQIKLLFGNHSFSISDCNWTRTQNHLVHKRTLIHLAKLAQTELCTQL